MIRILTLSALAAVLAAPVGRAQQPSTGADAGDRPAAPAGEGRQDAPAAAPETDTPAPVERDILDPPEGSPRAPAAGEGRQDAPGAAPGGVDAAPVERDILDPPAGSPRAPGSGRARPVRPAGPPAPAGGAATVDVTTAPVGRDDAGGPTVAVNDALFAEAAAVCGMAEMTMSQIGVERARDPELRRFSEQMIEDHTRLNRQLVAVASQVGYTLPTAVDARARFHAESLRGESPQKFNARYAKAQLLAHEDAVALFEAEAERGEEPHMKAMAAEALPHLKAHLAAIRPIAARYENSLHQAETQPRR